MPEKFAIPTPKPGPFAHGPDSERHAGVPRGAVTQHELPFRHDTFTEFRWLGFVAGDDVDGVFYLDGMKLSVE